MANLTAAKRFDFAGADPTEARRLIRTALRTDPKSTRKIYAALAHKVWTLLIERRLDDEVRSWHGLLQAVKGAVFELDGAVSERIIALSDLLNESISLAAASPAEDLSQRPNARRILERLAREERVSREELLKATGLKSAHLSNVLSQLQAHNLVERQEVGKRAMFHLTQRGRAILGIDDIMGADNLIHILQSKILQGPAPGQTAAARVRASQDFMGYLWMNRTLDVVKRASSSDQNVAVTDPTDHLMDPYTKTQLSDRWAALT